MSEGGRSEGSLLTVGGWFGKLFAMIITTIIRIRKRSVALALATALSLCCCDAFAGKQTHRNPPSECSGANSECGCPAQGDSVANSCIMVNIALGETTPWTGSMKCELKVFADENSPSVFTADSLYAVLGGYTFKRLGTVNLDDGVTPKEVVLSHPKGEPVHFVFEEGESVAKPDPGIHIQMDERLMMVDAEGWAVTKQHAEEYKGKKGGMSEYFDQVLKLPLPCPENLADAIKGYRDQTYRSPGAH